MVTSVLEGEYLGGYGTRVEEGELTAVVLIAGDVEILVSRELARVTAELLPTCGLPAFNHTVFRASDADPSEALRAARTLPMMADRRIVVVKDVQHAPGAFLEALVDYVASPSESTSLVLTAGKFGKAAKGQPDWGSRLRNAVKKHGTYVAFDTAGVPPARFLEECAQALGCRLEGDAGPLLLALVGSDLGLAARELEKVAIYAGEGVIRADHVSAACSALAEQDAWAITSAIARADASAALAVLQPLLEADHSSGRVRMILGQLAWQIRQVAIAADAAHAGASDVQVSALLKGYGKRDIVSAVRTAFRNGQLRRGHAWMNLLAEANRRMNCHRAGDRRVLEELVLDLCGA